MRRRPDQFWIKPCLIKLGLKTANGDRSEHTGLGERERVDKFSRELCYG